MILIIIGLVCIFCYRSFCRFLCPLGALYSLFNRFAITGIRVDTNRCNHCGACVRHCEMDIRHVGDHECISCGKCINTCAQGAISLKCGKFTLKGPETGQNACLDPIRAKRKRNGRIAWEVMLAVLVFALIYYNFIDVPEKANAQSAVEAQVPEAPEAAAGAADVTIAEDVTAAVAEGSDEPTQSMTAGQTGSAGQSEAVQQQDIQTGYEVGQQMEDFSCQLTDGSTFHLAEMRGKIVIINQWATYCSPCVGELPYFEKLQEEHPEIVILAFHHWLESNPKALPYIEQMGWSNWKLLFTVDTPDMNILKKIGGDNTMPRTVVLNKDGIVVYNEQRSVTYEMLLSLLEMASAEGAVSE